MSKWDESARYLREEMPGEWGLIDYEMATPDLVYRIRSGASPSFRPAGAYEAKHENERYGTYAVWARYIGENGEYKW